MTLFQNVGVLGATPSRRIDPGTRILLAAPVPSFKGKTGSPDQRITESTVARRRQRNEDSLQNANVKAFLQAIAQAEGGDYDLKFGGVVGKTNDPWRIKDFSRHPGPGKDGKTTAAGRYQINKVTWNDFGVKLLGLSSFEPKNQDLVAVEILRSLGALGAVESGDLLKAVPLAARRWNALPQGPGKGNRVKSQRYVPFATFVKYFKDAGGRPSTGDTPK